jgi:small subunit ribosomal protein S17
MSEQTTDSTEAEQTQTPAPDPGPSSPAPAAPEPSGAASRVNRRKVREGLVASAAMDKTAVVSVVERVRHPRYAKTVQRTKRLYVHDEDNSLRVGDRVRVQETRPLSKQKRWRLVEVLERAK